MKNYIFDFDGTLADSKLCSILATQQAFIEMALEKPEKDVIEYYMGIPIEQSFKEMASRALDDEGFDHLLKLFRQAYKAFENDSLTIFPYIPEVLSKLKKNGKRLYVVSSKKSDVLLRNLKTLQIDSYFDDLIGSDQVEQYKPHPDGIHKLVDRHSLTLKDTVMIGDAIFDIQMGQSAGCYTCGVTWGSHAEKQLQSLSPTFLVHKVQDLVDLSLESFPVN